LVAIAVGGRVEAWWRHSADVAARLWSIFKPAEIEGLWRLETRSIILPNARSCMVAQLIGPASFGALSVSRQQSSLDP